MAKSKVENLRAYRKRQKEKGLCEACPQPVRAPGATYCAYHHAKHLQRMIRMKQRRHAKGMCYACGRPRLEKDSHQCPVCLDKKAHLQTMRGVN